PPPPGGPGAAPPRPRRVTIQQRRLVQYRVTLFERLRTVLADRNIELRVLYGQASPTDAKRNDAGHLDWGDEVRARWFSIRGTELLWQPWPRATRRCDLAILTQENKILSNLPIQALQAVRRGRKVGYWGHGRNLQSDDPDSASERFKKLLLTKVHWWFGYTEHTRDLLIDDGFPPDRITSLDNAIDNDAFVADLDAVDDERLDALRTEIDLAPGAPLGLYCGSLYVDKRVDLLLDVAERVHARHPSFRLVVIGDGPTRPEVETFAADRPWVHWVGVRHGVEKAAWFRLATVYLSPGAVGLHVLDAFAAGIPMFTSTSAKHGPEICYLEHDVNGFVLEPDAESFADTVADVLDEPVRLEQLVTAGHKAAERYTLANMVERFADGIEAALDAPRP
ncbi:MAG: glycosyltransferase family 4 protein, partial [Actinomycetota bacterium]